VHNILRIFFIAFQPPFSSTRFCGMVIVAYLWSSVLWFAIPEEEVGGINWRWLIVFVPFACALGMIKPLLLIL
jgi:DnaJ family protein C protein 22